MKKLKTLAHEFGGKSGCCKVPFFGAVFAEATIGALAVAPKSKCGFEAFFDGGVIVIHNPRSVGAIEVDECETVFHNARVVWHVVFGCTPNRDVDESSVWAVEENGVGKLFEV